MKKINKQFKEFKTEIQKFVNDYPNEIDDNEINWFHDYNYEMNAMTKIFVIPDAILNVIDYFLSEQYYLIEIDKKDNQELIYTENIFSFEA